LTRRGRQIRRWNALGLAGVIALTLAACGGIDTGKLEDEVRSDAQDQADAARVDATVTSVDCPDDIKSETGEQFECQVSFSDGSSATAHGEVTDGDDGDVEYRFTAD
jgi:uncharacterized protein DUF4333